MLLDLQFSTADIERLVSTNALAMLGLPKPGNRSSMGESGFVTGDSSADAKS
jgi:hypothetical protein